MKLGKFLKELRTRAGEYEQGTKFTQEDVVNRLKKRGLDISPTTYTHYEAGRYVPPERFIYIAEALATPSCGVETIMYNLYKLSGHLDRIRGIKLLDMLHSASDAQIEYLTLMAEQLLAMQERGSSQE